ncbi:TonB-linked SusC/RagA family outer membrane protein [Anseongella ginsenosidimutans]|uniref:TonB-linked SusC/RagA family outer membrane protein n=1 Tax=Anseongella ginsenosidimutans TaxID=496056 RepID=A0A4R3KLR5_9SPHI|nr:TonB-dependent receptor [Anseongella ginsenosidimutans]QEC53791.1 TonB-dependent receptor [Anseongella ginsenosidimutans]TCS84932.1 TonB-linked SusC/RagA family outer membrane protein [Anseongella ginsenosidimutans]
MKRKILRIHFGGYFLFVLLVSGIYSFNATAVEASKYEILSAGAVREAAVDSAGIEIKGTVSDSVGLLPGVAISVKGSPNIGTATDQNGKFILEIPDKNATLLFELIGYTTLEVPVMGRPELQVQLKINTAALEEVVVVAFGEQKKEDVIGAVTTVNPSDLKIPSSNLTTALAGQISGMIAYQRSGEPGADNADFFIRGVTTFGYKKDPLILIDGIEVSSTELARLQPDNIASFSILKDATATSLYGARGANGVILITTKEGKEGKISISMRLENSISAPTRNIELADPITYMEMGNEAVLTRNALAPQPYLQSKIDRTAAGGNPYVYPATDWQDALFKDYTLNQRFNMNASGGGKVARYYLAGTFNQDNGVLKVDGRNNFNSNVNLKTYGLRSNINIDMTKTTEVVVRLSGNFDDYIGPINGGSDVYHQVMHTNPVLFPAFYEADEAHSHIEHVLFGNFGTDANYVNPYANLVKGYKEYSRSQLHAQFEVEQDFSFIAKGLKGGAIFNTSRYSYFDVTRQYVPFYYTIGGYDRFTDSYQLAGLNETEGEEYLDWVGGAKDIESTTYLQASLTYQRLFTEKHDLSAMLIGIIRNRLSGNAGDLQRSLPFRNAGISGRATYSYDSRYYAEFNFGYNGSERFHKSQRFGFFPSAGVAWNISNEKFWEPVRPVISLLKIRATYGLVGNDAIGSEYDRFFYLSNVDMESADRDATFGTLNGYHRTGVDVSRYSNRNITWEEAKKTNIGIELEIKDKFTLEADYFHEYRSNILMDRESIPETMGLSAVVRANVGEAASQGIDGSFTYSNFFRDDFWLKVRGNFTLAASEFKVYEEPQYEEAYRSRVGYPLSQYWGYIAERLFVDDEETFNSPRQNFGTYGGGDIKYRDVNGDGQITERDQVAMGHPTDPEIIYGFGFSTGFKRFDLSCFFQGSARSSFWIDAEATSPFNNETQLLKAYADSYWSEENRNSYALWPRLSPTVNENNVQRSNWFMRDGDFLRLKSVELGYTLPERAMERIGISNARFYLNGTNLFVISKFKLWDVEMGGYGLGYPVQRVLNLGVHVTL